MRQTNSLRLSTILQEIQSLRSVVLDSTSATFSIRPVQCIGTCTCLQTRRFTSRVREQSKRVLDQRTNKRIHTTRFKRPQKIPYFSG
ncbi:uncharacterized protein LACBIDRAFT_301668 [Laccaria bicolor S238N-H82]|uniref:Predicted protein n=1 Tax=Laccaria bicolor (strain S238N-H82 / ATCC MYA-4686) TaxID=486041 RepID=B0CP10_LACBS|nr:uncharacterized protein LACBIDRAFT_301668 [Laccaria bicolor S238N-H82]EDR15391.1 predicted protein [Laccaria bicolor S238N-H82]|eukprot:XP_001873599.1 predicted protein [Laccaria bicolor S238N-H82]